MLVTIQQVLFVGGRISTRPEICNCDCEGAFVEPGGEYRMLILPSHGDMYGTLQSGRVRNQKTRQWEAPSDHIDDERSTLEQGQDDVFGLCGLSARRPSVPGMEHVVGDRDGRGLLGSGWP